MEVSSTTGEEVEEFSSTNEEDVEVSHTKGEALGGHVFGDFPGGGEGGEVRDSCIDFTNFLSSFKINYSTDFFYSFIDHLLSQESQFSNHIKYVTYVHTYYFNTFSGLKIFQFICTLKIFRVYVGF